MSFPVHEDTVGTGFTGTPTDHNVSMPGTVNEGDLLVVILGVNVSTTVNVPSGWSRIEDIAEDSTSVYAKVADGTEGGGSVNWTTTAGANGAANCLRVSNWWGALAGLEINAENTQASTTAPDANSVTASWGTADNLFLWLSQSFDDDENYTASPSGYSTVVNTVSGGGTNAGASSGTASKASAASSDDPGTGTLDATGFVYSWTAVVRPATAADVDNRRNIRGHLEGHLRGVYG